MENPGGTSATYARKRRIRPSRGSSAAVRDSHWQVAIRKLRFALMTKVKEAIEEVIEESYLLGLSEPEIRKDFKRFIDTCFVVIHDHVKDRDVVTGLAESLAREQTCILIADRGEGSGEVGVSQGSGEQQATLEEFSEKVARRKRQILRTIAKYDPQLVRLIDEQRFQGEGGGEPSRPPLGRLPWRPSWRPDWIQLRLQLLKIGYATTIGVIILLIWLGFIQK